MARQKVTLLDDVVAAAGASDVFEVSSKRKADRLWITATVSAGNPTVTIQGRAHEETTWIDLVSTAILAASPLDANIENNGIYELRVTYSGNTGTLRSVLSWLEN